MSAAVIPIPLSKPARMCWRLVLLLGCLATAGTARADYPIEVIELKARTLDEVLPVVRPLVGGDAAVTGMGNQLIIKASPAQVEAVRKLLAEIDRPPKRLLITVSNQGGDSGSSAGYTGSADIRIGQGQIGINSPGRPVSDSQASIALHDSDSRRTRSASQQVQALEGRPAYISGGTQVPIRERQSYFVNGVPYQSDLTRLQNVSSGFYVVPRLSGEYVSLEIIQHDDRHAGVGGRIDTQRASTTVRARRGEWVELGGIDTSGSGSRSGLGYANRSQQLATQQIRVKVECLDCPP
jgi:type II secretory pathway component GspD/PulD (secretin)